jgi:phosphate transport system permease protein
MTEEKGSVRPEPVEGLPFSSSRPEERQGFDKLSPNGVGSVSGTPTDWAGAIMQRRIRKRYAAERRFRLFGLAAVALSTGFLAFLLVTISIKGGPGLTGAFLTGSDATDPELAGIWGAFKGSLLTVTVTLAIAFPVGVLTAVYLEEYAPRNRWTDVIEVSINNLAAVPSIIFGLLGLAVFLNFMHLPRSAPLVGGITLALMTMPVIVIAGRNAVKSVPPSIRDAALGVGASKVQVVFHHVLPLALPGILTGTIIGMARALGETAPLLMIGMRAFISTPPGGFTDPATVLPVQIFLWSDEVSHGFVEKTSAAILVLLAFLLAMNGLAIYLRNKFERRW